MTINRNHPALINNDDTIFDLSIDETTMIISDTIRIYSARLTYVMTNLSDSHDDDFFMIQSILTQLMPISSYHSKYMTTDEYSALLETNLNDTTINDILYFEHYNNCAATDDELLILNHFNKLTEEQLDKLLND